MLQYVHIQHLRNISDLVFEPSAGINIFYGENGSGKSSLLEALHILALGRSFRTRSLDPALQFSHTIFQVLAKLSGNRPLGLQYQSQTGIKIKLNGLPLRRLSDLAYELPLQFIPANCHLFFELGPRYRRQIIDWGLFHVEPGFNLHWQHYKKALQQRNSLLKKKANKPEIQLWDDLLIRHGERINQLRQQQLELLVEQFKILFPTLCPEYADAEFSFLYKTGWKKDQDLRTALTQNLMRDKELGYTRVGPHAADWTIQIQHTKPEYLLSRGQQKLFFLTISLCQAQIAVQSSPHRTKTLLLLDDLGSELDKSHQANVLNHIQQLPVQAFITTLDDDKDLFNPYQVFHVKQGQLK